MNCTQINYILYDAETWREPSYLITTSSFKPPNYQIIVSYLFSMYVCMYVYIYAFLCVYVLIICFVNCNIYNTSPPVIYYIVVTRNDVDVLKHSLPIDYSVT